MVLAAAREECEALQRYSKRPDSFRTAGAPRVRYPWQSHTWIAGIMRPSQPAGRAQGTVRRTQGSRLGWMEAAAGIEPAQVWVWAICTTVMLRRTNKAVFRGENLIEVPGQLFPEAALNALARPLLPMRDSCGGSLGKANGLQGAGNSPHGVSVPYSRMPHMAAGSVTPDVDSCSHSCGHWPGGVVRP